MKRFLAALSVLALAAASSGCGSSADVAASSAAANVFRNETSTAGGYSTWDSDLIGVEAVSETGAGVYVAVLDTGLVANWRDYFPAARIAASLGTGFDQPVTFGNIEGDPCGLGFAKGALTQSTFVGSTGSSHGTHVTSTILGYFYDSNSDTAGGVALPPIMVRGIAPDVTIIPVRVLADYQVPARPNCTDPGPLPARGAVFGTDEMVAAGIDYVTSLAERGIRPIVINMSLGSDPSVPISDVEKAAIDRAIAAGVIVVAAAGNEDNQGMGAPGSYAPVISAGAAGWKYEWQHPTTGARYRLWWLQSPFRPFRDVADPTAAGDVYVTDFSSRATAAWQDLDVLAPGSWVRGPFAGDPGYSHLPWWSSGIGDLRGLNPGNFYYVGGTSMAAPHVTGTAAMMLQRNPNLQQADVERILEATALTIPASGSMSVMNNLGVFETIKWGGANGETGNAVGAGLIQVDAAVAAAAGL